MRSLGPSALMHTHETPLPTYRDAFARLRGAMMALGGALMCLGPPIWRLDAVSGTPLPAYLAP